MSEATVVTTHPSLNPTRAVYSVIGNLCKNPQSLRDPEVILMERDFPQEFHKIVFSAVYNLAYSSAETTRITEIDVDNYLAQYGRLYKIWEQHQGLDYVRDCINHANIKTFKSNYDKLKKFSLLRSYVENGFDVSDLYDYRSTNILDQEKSMKKLEKMTIQQIIEHYSLKMMALRDEWRVGQDAKDFKAGDDLDTLLEDLNKEPEFGYPFRNGYYNAIFRGMRDKKFMLRSAGTGAGKTRQAIADSCNVSCDMIFDYDKGWISNGPAQPSLFISTELEKQELQTTMLAFITGVNEQVIKNGRYSQQVHERLKEGIAVLKKAPIFAVYVDDFSIADIEMIIERYIIEENVRYVFFDYIQMTPKLSRTMQSAFGGSLREDQILVQFSAALKTLANKYEIYISSSTQLNRASKDENMRDTSSLRGGSATADKVDHGVITFKVRDKDRENIKHILERGGFAMTPNYSHWVYKNRSGRDSVIIWTRMDLGTMRETALFITDMDYNLINDIEQINISYDDTPREDYVTDMTPPPEPERTDIDYETGEIIF